MAKLEIPVVVDIDAVEELIEELKHLQTYKLGVGDDLILVDRDAVVEIFARHVKAKRREEWKTGRWIQTHRGERGFSRTGFRCDQCGEVNPRSNYCPSCGARMEGGE